MIILYADRDITTQGAAYTSQPVLAAHRGASGEFASLNIRDTPPITYICRVFFEFLRINRLRVTGCGVGISCRPEGLGGAECRSEATPPAAVSFARKLLLRVCSAHSWEDA